MATTLGVFSRPWNQFDLETALSGAVAAGYETFGLMRMQGSAPISQDSTPEEVDAIRGKVEAAGLAPLVSIASINDIEGFCRFLDNLKRAGMTTALVCGAQKAEERERYYGLLREVAEYASGIGMRIALKPHGGISATAADCARALDTVDHEGLEIWYDPGNIIYYTGQNPTEDVKDIAGRVAGVCVKDCANGMKGTVAVSPGTGDVDFDAVLGALYDGGFDGPLVVECVGGEGLEEINAEAAKTVTFLKETLARIGAG